jgi:hypothetical protein
MERIFLSYSRNPYPYFTENTDRLQRAARVAAAQLGLLVVDGVDLGGRSIDAEIDRRINEADALVAIVTLQAGFGLVWLRNSQRRQKGVFSSSPPDCRQLDYPKPRKLRVF